jgi:hypothetical protein
MLVTVINNTTFGGWEDVPIDSDGSQARLQFLTGLDNVLAGEILDVYAAIQVVNNTSPVINVETCCVLTLHSTWPPSPGYDFTGANTPASGSLLASEVPAVGMGENIAPGVQGNVGRHYMVHRPRLTWVADNAYPKVYAALWLYAASSSANGSQYLTSQGSDQSGKLTVVRITP